MRFVVGKECYKAIKSVQTCDKNEYTLPKTLGEDVISLRHSLRQGIGDWLEKGLKKTSGWLQFAGLQLVVKMALIGYKPESLIG